MEEEFLSARFLGCEVRLLDEIEKFEVDPPLMLSRMAEQPSCPTTCEW
jgi:hypothetical protein